MRLVPEDLSPVTLSIVSVATFVLSKIQKYLQPRLEGEACEPTLGLSIQHEKSDGTLTVDT